MAMGQKKKRNLNAAMVYQLLRHEHPGTRGGKSMGGGTLRRSVLCGKKDEKIVTRVRMGACR